MRSRDRLSALHACRPAGRSAGFTYIGLLVVIAIMGIMIAQVSPVWRTMQKRDKEEQLLWVGDQYRRALARYYIGGGEHYPHRLEDLLQDPRAPNVRRYLRQLYPDPITGKTEWGLIKVGDLITGIYSLSEEEPLKKAGFIRAADASFANKKTYSEWIFVPNLGRLASYPVAPPVAPPVSGITAPPGVTVPRSVSQPPGDSLLQPSPLQPSPLQQSPINGMPSRPSR